MKLKEKKEKKQKKEKKAITPRTPFAWVYLFFSFLLIAGGLAFVIFPQESANWTARILGGLVVVFFLFLFVFLCAREKKRNASFFCHLFAYLLAIVAGGYFIFAPDTVLTYLSMAVGVYALMDAGFKLRLAISGCRYRALLWWALTLTAGFSAVGGLVLLRFLPVWEADTVTTAIIMGISMLCAGLANFIAAFEKTAVEQAQAKEAAAEHTTVVMIDTEAAERAAAEMLAARASEVPTPEAAEEVVGEPVFVAATAAEPATEPIAEPIAPVEAPIEEPIAPVEAPVEEPTEPSVAEGDTPDAPTAEFVLSDEEADAMVDSFLAEQEASPAAEGDEAAARAERFDAMLDDILALHEEEPATEEATESSQENA